MLPRTDLELILAQCVATRPVASNALCTTLKQSIWRPRGTSVTYAKSLAAPKMLFLSTSPGSIDNSSHVLFRVILKINAVKF